MHSKIYVSRKAKMTNTYFGMKYSCFFYGSVCKHCLRFAIIRIWNGMFIAPPCIPWVAFTCPCMFIPIHETTRIVLVPVSSAARALYMAVYAWLGGLPVPSGGPTSGDIYGKGATRKPGICSLWSAFPGWTRLTLPDWLTLITLFKPRVVIMWRTQSETNLND